MTGGAGEKGIRGMTVAPDKTGVGSGRDDWRTPPEFFAKIDRLWHFDYDAFASHDNALCATYSTPDGTYEGWNWKRSHAQLSPLDGLTFSPGDGEPRRRFGNPPYSRGFIEQACQWFAESREMFDISVLLIPANTDTRWWHEWVKPYATVYLLRGRIHFIDPATGEPGGSPPGGSALAVYLPEFLR